MNSGVKRNANDTVNMIEPIIVYGKRPAPVSCIPRVSIIYHCYGSYTLVGYWVTDVQLIWSPNKIATTYAGVQSINETALSIKGARPEGTAYFIDGVRVRSFD